jgi:hypothetical protein
MHHKGIGFYNQDEKCLLCGMNRVLKKKAVFHL